MRGNFSRVLWAARGRAEHISVVSVSHRKRVMLSEASAPRVWRCEIVWRVQPCIVMCMHGAVLGEL